MADDDIKKLEEQKLTNDKLSKLTKSIDESAEDAEFARQEAAANAADSLGGSEEEQQETNQQNKAEFDQRKETNSTLAEIAKNGRKAASDSKGIGGMLGGKFAAAGGALGGVLGGLGMGIGAAGAGIGVALLGAATFAEKIADLDGKKIKDNIVEIMSIPDSVGGNLEMMAKGGALTLALTGLGIGLAAFGAGSAGAAGAAAFTEGTNFAGTIKEQVTELLSIGDSLGGNTKMLQDGGAFFLAMTGIGAGLAVFGVGSAVAGLSDGIKTFTGTGNFAENIKEQVVTLLSISGELGGAGNLIGQGAAFLLAMTGIGAGLAVFGAGAAIASIGQGLGDGIAKFSDTSFAQGVKDSVITLLSISDELGGAGELIGEAGTFFLAMTGIGAGLAVFGAGAAIASVGQGLGDGIAKFSDSTFAQSIVDNVTTLLGLSDSLGGASAFIGDSATFLLAMAGIGAGLAAFGVGSGIGSFIDGVGKLFGGQSPIDKVLSLADKAAAIERIGPAFEKAAAGINSFGSKIRFFDNESAGVQSFLTFLGKLSGEGRGGSKIPAINALSGLMGSFSEIDRGRAITKASPVDNSQGAAMAAIQNDTLERIAAATEAQLAFISGGSNSTTNNVTQTQVNQSNIPDRDLTTSMYGVNHAM